MSGYPLTTTDYAILIFGFIFFGGIVAFLLGVGIYRLAKFVGWKLLAGGFAIISFIVLACLSAFTSCEPLRAFMARGY